MRLRYYELKMLFSIFIFFIIGEVMSMKSDQGEKFPLDPAYVRSKAPKNHEPVVIVGGGLAGMSAAISALGEGANVILIEKEKAVGGNSAKASSGINGCETETQKALNIVDSCDLFYKDTILSGDRENDPALVDVLVHDSSPAIDFLIGMGVNLSDINLCGGHSIPRTHWLPSPKAPEKPTPVGIAIIRALKAHLDNLQNGGKLEIRTGTKAIGLVTWNDFVTGIRTRKIDGSDDGKVEEVKGKAVVLTTGGFSSDLATDGSSLLMEFAPKLSHLPTTNGPFATGDGVKMARAMGAELVGMDRVQVHPTAFIDPKEPAAKTKFLAAEALRGKGAILINEEGKRFANELGRRDQLTEQINKNCKRQVDADNLPITFMVMNDEAAKGFGRPAFNFYSKIKGFFKEYQNYQEVAKELLKSDPNILKQTLEEYNSYYESSSGGQKFKDPFGKTVFPVKFDLEEKLYVARITPAVHYTMGGLKFDTRGFVFNELLQKPFQGLLAAGEVTGGVHGHNRLAGNSLLECVVFGRIAGRSAARINYQFDSAETVDFPPSSNSASDKHGEL